MSGYNKKTAQAESTRLSKISVLISVIAGLMVVALLVYLGVVENITLQPNRNDSEYIVVQDYDVREVERADTPIGVVEEYTFTIDQKVDNDTHLGFYTVHQYIDVYLEGQLIYSLKPSKENQIGKTVGSNWTMIPIYREDAGKEVRVEITPAYESFRNRKVEFLIGSSLAIYVDRLYRDLPQLILGILTVFVGFVFFCMAGYSLLKKHRGSSLLSLALLSMMMGLWRLTDTRFTPFIISEKPVFLFYISLTMLMIGVVPLIKSMEERFNRISCRFFDGYFIMAAIICIIQLLLQIFGITDLRESLFVTHTVIIVGAVILIGNAIFDRIKYPENRGKGGKLSLILVVGVVADIIAYYIKGTSSGLLFSLLAFLLYIVFTGIFMMFQHGEQEKQLAEDERLLTENRISTMISQIQPHFIYNTLGTVEQLCMKQPEQAAELVHNFALYLRGNFGELDNVAPIHLSKEIDHVRHYVEIEQVRFPDMTIKFDLHSGDFLLPALSIQPLVENAIKHGLMGLESGGTVTVTTYETNNYYCVKVEDDGVGFDVSVFHDAQKHIGIRNIRGRLEAMCGGTLTVDSIPGQGTMALIKIPK